MTTFFAQGRLFQAAQSRCSKALEGLVPLRLGWILISLTLLSSAPVPAAPPPAPWQPSARVLEQIQAFQTEKLSRSPAERKLDSQLLQAARAHRGFFPLPILAESLPSPLPENGGRILVDLKADPSPELIHELLDRQAQIISIVPRHQFVRAWCTLDLVEQLAQRPDVHRIKPASQAMTSSGSLDTEGNITHRASEVRTQYGVAGAGIKIGVLSDGIDHLAASQLTGDLPSVTVLPGQAGGVGQMEGTAMLEIIHDIAPGAELYFASALAGEAAFAENIRALYAAGCRIIVDDISYFAESPFQDDLISQAVQEVSQGGALYFAAAGNSGNKNDNTSGTWEGDFVDGGPASIGRGGRLHDFGGSTSNPFVEGGGFRRVDLSWADPLGASTNDYDVYVLNAAGQIVASSTNIQDGNDDPYESISNIANGERIVIVKASGAGRFLSLRTGRGRLAYSTTGTVFGHNASGASNAFSVAATWVRSPAEPFVGGPVNPVETYSSGGPRRMFFEADGRPITPGNYGSTGGLVLNKPDITAADGVVTTVPGFEHFFGTSAAAPHAAAIAALVWSYNPSLSAQQVKQAILSSALDIEAPGFDIDSGAGIVSAPGAILAAPSTRPRLAALLPIIEAGNGNGLLDRDECNTVRFTIANQTSTNGVIATQVTASLRSLHPSVAVAPLTLNIPDIPPGTQRLMESGFPVSVLRGFSCADTARFALELHSANGGSITQIVVLPTSPPGLAAPQSFSSSSPATAIPDLSTIEVPLTVQGIDLPIAQVRVAVHLTHPYLSDIKLSLVSPDGDTIVLMNRNGNSGQNLGISCTQKTVFDDASTNLLSLGTAPYSGSVKPLESLSLFQGKTGTQVNGTWKLRVSDVADPDSGRLECWSLELTPIFCISGDGECFSPPLIVSQPSALTIRAGQNAVFNVQAEGTAPLQYQWRKDLVNLPAQSGLPSLQINAVSPNDDGLYDVVIQNNFGSVTSNPVRLQVVTPPSLGQQPENLFLEAGKPGTMAVSATGSDPLQFQWFRSPATLIEDASGPILSFPAASFADVGGYYAVVSNGYGSVTSRVASLAVGVAPSILQQPADASVTQGSTVVFKATASGTPPLQFQWYHPDSTPLPGATNIQLTLPSVQLSQAGGYHLRVSNPFGLAQTREAQLLVSPPNNLPEVILTSPTNSATITASQLPVLINATASDSDGSIKSVDLYTDGRLLSSLATPPYQFSWNDPSAGVHRIVAVAMDQLGGIATSAPVSINVQAAAVRTTLLVSTGAVWKYWDQGAAPADWNSPNYDDSPWKSGPAELGYGDGPARPEATLIEFGPNASDKYITTYFRYVFHCSDPLSVTQLVTQILRDDGAAVYLNGTPLFRDNLPLDGPLQFSTLALSAVNAAAETTYFTHRSPPLGLVAGKNVLAVEVHQSSANSTDLSFDLRLQAEREFSPRWFLTPESVSAVAGETVTLESEATGGTPLTYRWFFNQTNLISNATSPTLTLGPLKTNQSGSYSVVVTNLYGAITSSPAVVTVSLPATNVPPTLQWLSPAEGTIASLNQWPILIAVEATDTDSGIAEVRFLADNRTLLRMTSPPFVWEWIDGRAGTHTLQAIATDNLGASVTSAPVRVEIQLPAENTPIPLIPVAGVWNYDDTGVQPPSAWTAFNFNDESWKSGAAELGYGDETEGRPETTVIGFGTNPTAKYPAAYFRHPFWITDLRHITGLEVALLRDDGAAVYLNGQELFRDNLPPGVLSITNLALTAINGAGETNFLSFNTNQANLRQGLNVIAVEVHQSSRNSSDLSFALSLSAQRGFPPEITRQPASQQVTNGATVSFNVGYDGARPMSFQWFFNANTPLIGATGAVLRLVNVTTNSSGLYRVLLSNEFGVLLSSNATLTVVPPPPNQPPSIAFINPTNNSTWNPGQPIPVTLEASDTDGSITRVELWADQFRLHSWFGTPYEWTWPDATAGEHLLEARAYDNTGTVSTSAPVRIRVASPDPAEWSLVAPRSIWRYLDDGSNQGATWRAPAFNDQSWKSGPAVLGYGNAAKGRPDATELNSTSGLLNLAIVTHYFRHAFVVTNLSNISQLTLQSLRDDGISVYLNGVRVQRNNLPNGSLGYRTLASSSITGPDETNWIAQDVPLNLLNLGTNVLAAEVHQSSLVPSDAAFDARLTAIARLGPVLLSGPYSQSVSNGEPAQFGVVATGSPPLNYQWFFNQTNAINGATGPQLRINTVSTNNEGFYSVRIQNELGSIVSSQAFLKILIPQPNTPPVVRMIQPTNGAAFTRGSIITLQATASDADGKIALVEFLDGTNILNSLKSSPYIFDWTDASLGSHLVTARATDNRGAVTVSSGTTITIVPPPPPPSQTVSLVPTGSVWRYFDLGTNPGNSWMNTVFDDSSWKQGPAELGYGDTAEDRPEATVVGFGPDARNKFITTYFRTTFILDASQQFTNLTAQLLRDDGAVVYLNGLEVFRSNMPEGPISPNTLASSAVNKLQEATYYETNIPIQSLRPGANVVAVEVHQSAANSSDLSFDLGLTGIQIGSPVFIQQPTDQIVLEGTPVEFNVQVAGAAPLSYQWFYNRLTPLDRATNATLRFTSSSRALEGSYSVVVSNAFGTLRSEDATLTVLQGGVAITLQPLDTSAEPGTTARFDVAAQGIGTLRYQWYFNTNTPLANQTNASLILSSITPAQAGFYSVRVSNNSTNILSDQAELRILIKPAVLGFEYSGTTASLTFTTLNRLRYTLEFSDFLSAPPATPALVWKAIPGGLQIKGTGGPLTLTDPFPPATKRFYRIRVE